MTDLSTQLAEARRIAEEAREVEQSDVAEATDILADLAGPLAAAILALIPVVEALQTIAEERDAGRHDGLPEPCPAHDADAMFAVARTTLATLTEALKP